MKLNRSTFHAVFCIALGMFFIYAGTKKFIPKPPRQENNEKLIEAVTNNTYTQPAAFYVTMKALKQTGFLKVVGMLQILSGVLMCIPKTRFLGLVFLFPIVLNIFLLHVLLDNKPSENIETGLLVLVNIVLGVYYHATFRYFLR